MQQTPLYDVHKRLGAKMIDFGGWSVPLSYKSVIDEHNNVRNNCGIFDISHMGQILVEGKDAEALLNLISINDITALKVGSGHYSAMLNNNGGVIDDIIIYKVGVKNFLICVNAANIQKDESWIQSFSDQFDFTATNLSAEYGMLAVQGPKSFEFLESTPIFKSIKDLQFMEIKIIKLTNYSFYIARTGYTGEKGIECFIPNQYLNEYWNMFVEAGALPCGFGARDSLRLEAGLPLYGKELSDSTPPKACIIDWAMKNKNEFIGKSGPLTQSEAKYKLVMFKMLDSSIARDGMNVFDNQNNQIGYISSAGYLPSFKCSGGFVYLSNNYTKIGTEFWVDIRGKRMLATVSKRPLYSSRAK